MRITKLVLTLSVLMLVGGCTNTYYGARDNVRDVMNWAHHEPSHMEKRWGKAPTGYYGQNKRHLVLKPPQEHLVWNEVGAPPIGHDQGNVTVYQVDDGAPPYVDNTYPQEVVYADYGQLMHQLYFGHGSSAIGKADKKRLTSFGKSIMDNDTAALTVVGHASHRVDGVEDPMRRKEINFEMAQKRANAVTQALKSAGVSPGWIEAISRGEEEATGNEETDRRADVYMR